ncbi:probable basic-leucine zipper transcription factor R [Drosophila sulfurigaster albostrigata]|uniref:probable basic-leucine zipper transcription factor R n=1 Tax=Drosophila sulfurigaster albostrigata TaxID=89887 RepID=UPI002D21B3E3|nr:probable basic-leucine zipper transcription factor R [Drosophila sulfurigaster albostrigata]
MSNGDDVLDNWEELDEAGLCMTLQTKLQTANNDDVDSRSSSNNKSIKPATSTILVEKNTKMKVLQRPQSLQESSVPTAASATAAPKQIMIARKPAAPTATATAASTGQTDGDVNAPVMMVLHKSASEYDAANYANPINNQTVKILRRPAQAEERRDSNGMRPKQPIKTLQQREQEYAQARLRILGSAKNPEDDKPATPTTPVSNASTAPVNSTPWQAESTPYAANFNNNNNNNNNSSNGPGPGAAAGAAVGPAAGMHRSSSAPKMSQSATPMYNYNNYYQAPPPPQQQHTPAMSYIYSAPIFQHQRMPPYGAGQAAAAAAGAAPTPNPQQSWSPVVGGSVSAALLRQQSMHSPALHHQQHQQQQQHHQQQQQPASAPPQYAHPYNDNVLRLPRGPCPNGTIGFQMRR